MGRRLFVICQSYRFTAYRSIPAAAGSSTSFRASREMLGVPARKAQSQPPMSYLTLKITHLTGLALTFMGLAGVLASSVAAPAMPGPRRLFLTCHGLGLVILLVTGFALTLQLGIGKNLPGWIWGKVVIWLLVGASATVARRLCRFQVSILVWFLILMAGAAWLALYKPF